jgi:xanthine dehydrogenase accessory factor
LIAKASIGDNVEEGQVIAVIEDQSSGNNGQFSVISPLAGVLRGIIRDGINVPNGIKIGDVDPRNDPSACYLVSDKALAIGGGVLEAILSKEEIRGKVISF